MKALSASSVDGSTVAVVDDDLLLRTRLHGISLLQDLRHGSLHHRCIWRAFLTREWPYLLILLLALFGVAYTSFSKSPITIYWVVLAPFIGVICVVTRWRDAANREQRLHLVWTQALHWGAVLVAMRLIFVADVTRMMNADASALAALTVLALGTFTAGVHIAAWRICLVGIVLGVGVPGIAWFEQSTLLLLLVAVVLVAVTAPFFWQHAKVRKA